MGRVGTAIVLLAACALSALVAVVGSAQVQHAPTSAPVSPIRFRNVATESGIDFVLENSATPEKQLIETMPGGVVAFDYGGDGLIDIFFTNGASVPSLEKSQPKFRNRLYKNMGGMRFKDVTAEAGLAGIGYSMGATAADYDNDGHIDLFVTGVNSNHLYRNLGNGTFADVTQKAGIHSDVWSVAAGWFDYDKDGRLDLFVVNYLKWSPDNTLFCGDPNGPRAYCHPRFFAGLPNTLYHNRGDGTFEDVTEKAGVAGKEFAIGVAAADYDGDNALKGRLKAHRGVDMVVVHADQQPADAAERGGDGEHRTVDAIDVNAHLPRRIAILRSRAHRVAEFGEAQEAVQQRGAAQADAGDEDVHRPDRAAANRDAPIRQIDGQRARIGRGDELHELVEHEAQADGGEQ